MRALVPTTLSLHYSDAGARHLFYWLIAVELGFALAYVAIHILWPELTWGPFRPLSDLDGENSLSTWFSVVQLFFVGALLIFAALNNQRKHQLSNVALTIAGLVLIVLSIDEEAQLHENLGYTARSFGLDELPLVGRWMAWIWAYAAIGILALGFAAKHLIALWTHFRPAAVIGLAGAMIYLIGAIGFEIVSFPFRGSEDTRTMQNIAQTIEEFLEMLGVSVVLYATLNLASRLSTRFELEPNPLAYVRRSRQRDREFPRSSPA
jgi:hypothetical protein